MLGNFITLSLSVYCRFRSSGTIFVALLCTLSICCCSLLSDGTQAALPYSSMGLMRLVYSFLMVSPSLYVNARHIMHNILFACKAATISVVSHLCRIQEVWPIVACGGLCRKPWRSRGRSHPQVQ